MAEPTSPRPNYHQELVPMAPPVFELDSDHESDEVTLSSPPPRANSVDPRQPRRRVGSREPPLRSPRRYSPDRGMYSSASVRSTRLPRSPRSRRSHYDWEDDYSDRDGWGQDRYWRDDPHFIDYPDRRPPYPGWQPRSYPSRTSRVPEPELDQPKPPVEKTTSQVREVPAHQLPHKPTTEGYGSSAQGGGTMGSRIDWNAMTSEERKEVLRLPWVQWMNSDFKNHFVATLGELIGTTMFLLFAYAGTEVANIRSEAGNAGSDSNTTTGQATGFNVGVLLYISLAFGFSLMVNVWIFFRISGGLFNPAVTLGMLLIKAVPPTRAICLLFAQLAGSLLASVIVRFLFPENFNVRTTLGGGATVVQGVFIEALLTAELVFTIFMLAAEKHRATFIAPVGIGLALFIAELVGVQFTGGSLNPARSFGPCVVTWTWDKEHWIYWVGPLIGSLIAVVFYRFIKILEYEVANPGADAPAPENVDLENNTHRTREKLPES
ncbi:aquaporin-like protein [Astrocystis sublimbata]|nr:aquaporin-like protein [Astrocystis sublimbata]